MGAVALGYGVGANLLTPSQSATTKTVTETFTSVSTVASTTVFRTVNGTAVAAGDTVQLTFLGDNLLVVRSTTKSGAFGEIYYHYTRFPYSNFTYEGYKFTYHTGPCDHNDTVLVPILPCGSRLTVELPSYGTQEILGQANRLITQEYFSWIDYAVAAVNGHQESAGILLIVSEDGSRTVYGITQQ
jgi:hypothetical protein